MGSRIGGEEVGSREGGGSDPTYLQSNNKHTRSSQCKMIMGNIIVCPAGPKNSKIIGTHCRFGIAGNLGVVLAWLTECEHAATRKWEGTTCMRSEHGNSLLFISSAVHFLKNFPKKSIFSTTTSPKSRFSLHKHPSKKPFFGIFFPKKLLPKTQGRHPGGGGGVRPAVPTRRPAPTVLYQRHLWM